jgi:hypothetical protein
MLESIDNWTIGAVPPSPRAAVSASVGADYFQVIADGLLEFATGVATFDQVQQLADFVER